MNIKANAKYVHSELEYSVYENVILLGYDVVWTGKYRRFKELAISIFRVYAVLLDCNINIYRQGEYRFKWECYFAFRQTCTLVSNTTLWDMTQCSLVYLHGSRLITLPALLWRLQNVGTFVPDYTASSPVTAVNTAKINIGQDNFGYTWTGTFWYFWY